MTSAAPEADWERTLAPGRRVAGILSVLQMLGWCVLLGVVWFGGVGAKDAAYGLAAVILLAEACQWGLARAALRRCPGLNPDQWYASRRLDPAQQRLVEFNLVCSVGAPVLLARLAPTDAFPQEKLVLFGVLLAGIAPACLSLWRVRRNRSWLAISRIPARPGQPAPQ